MNTINNALIINTRFINRSDRELTLESYYHNAHKGFFPSLLQDSDSITLSRFEGDANLNGDILIDIGIKKPIFEAFCTYRNDRLVYEIKTSLLYAYEYVAYQQAPKAFFFWTHSAESIGYENSIAQSAIITHSESYPYSYSVDFHLG